MHIRKMQEKDYETVDCLMRQLHQTHVNGRPDLYTYLEHPYSKDEYKSMVHNEDVIGYVAEIDTKVVGLCIAALKNKSVMTLIKTAYIDAMVVEGA